MPGVMIATDMPQETEVVLLLDDDVVLSPSDVLAVAYQCHESQDVVFGSYPLRMPPGKEGQDNRLAHKLSPGGHISGGLGCTAIPAALFRHLHLSPFERVKVHPSLPESSCPYRVGVYCGGWMTEDLFFCWTLARQNVKTSFYPPILRHGLTVATKDFTMLDHSPMIRDLVPEL
jgi:hypothetical protein